MSETAEIREFELSETSEAIREFMASRQSVTFVFEPLPGVKKIPKFIEERLKKDSKGRAPLEVKNYRIRIEKNTLLFMDRASGGLNCLSHAVIDEKLPNGQLRPQIVAGKVVEVDGLLRVVAVPGRKPALRVFHQDLGRFGGDLARALNNKRYAGLLEKNGIDRKEIEDFVKLITQCKNAEWGIAIERDL